MSIVIVGHVDHGKSTVIGRMLSDTSSLPEGKLDQVRETCRRNSKPFEYAFLLDALKDEQEQGITIDAARIFFKSEKRNYIILDAPGHIEFLKNMVTGASRAEAALLVIDAKEGIRENSKRHGYLLSMLGIKQVSVVVNKMDLVGYDEKVYDEIAKEYGEFLEKIDVEAMSFIPVSGFCGDNVAVKSANMPWYEGCTVMEQLDSFKSVASSGNRPFRMPVQGVYKFTRSGDDRRIIAGTVSSGSLHPGDEIVFYPSGKKTTVETLEGFNAPEIEERTQGQDCGFTMKDQIYVKRGELAAKGNEPKPEVAVRIKANIFWLGKKPFSMDRKYLFKIGTSKVSMQIEKVLRVLNASNLESEVKSDVERNEVAECILKLDRPVAFDLAENSDRTSRFVIVDSYEISGGGIISETVSDSQSLLLGQVIKRNSKWEQSSISWEERARRYSQKPALVVINGPKKSGKKDLAKALEYDLFSEGKFVYYIGMSNILYGVDADIKVENSLVNRKEQVRRMAEVANIMLDSGMIVIVTTRGLNESDKEIVETAIGWENIFVFDIEDRDHRNKDIYLPFKEMERNISFIRNILESKGIIFGI